MRLAPLASPLAVSMLLAGAALADVGPPPKCGAGTHHEYYMGHRCVPDGSHLEADPAGGVRTVSDTGKTTPTVTPAPTAAPAPPPTAIASPPVPSAQPAPADPQAGATPPPAAAPPSRGCACTLASDAGGATGLLAGLAVLIATRIRRPRAPRARR